MSFSMLFWDPLKVKGLCSGKHQYLLQDFSVDYLNHLKCVNAIEILLRHGWSWLMTVMDWRIVVRRQSTYQRNGVEIRVHLSSFSG